MRIRDIYLIGIASASFFMSYFSRLAWSIVSTYSTLRPTIIEDSVVFSLFFVGYVAVQVPAGLISDRVNPKYIVMVSLIGLAVSSAVSGIADAMWIEYVASLFMGLSAGWIYPATVKLLTINFGGPELPIAMGYYSIAWPLSIVLAGAVLPEVCVALGWRWSYYLIALASVIIALLYMPIGAEYHGNNAHGSLNLRLLRNRDVIVVSLSGFLFFMSYWAITLYAYKYFLSIGLSDYVAGLAYSLLALLGVPSTLIAGYIIRRLGVKGTLWIFEAIYGVLTMMLAVVTREIPLMILASLMGFIRFVITPANSTAVSRIGREMAGSVTGLANLFWQLSGTVAPAAASLILTRMNYQALWIIMGIIIMLSAVMYQLMLKVR
ncbi:MFS transporter [Vulcanisaeta souniana]|uniref:MFS transporter n=1 Tax=Vulcanisaeta souniana JCM 11219 TaxID=1293586 RepID=A0A830E5L2_9CREN|nr:MFS transporter [Vulcanisaeta souniana]BDR92668.1 MFS transporter [Vulcanisaeta souniana JCM 11219]GGI84504.1 MFS transporter [Vulcanisaeta souniana JCM 11219]